MSGQGGVIAALEENMQITVRREDTPDYRSQTWPYPCIALDVASRYSPSAGLEVRIDAAHARELAALLVALADEIEGAQP